MEYPRGRIVAGGGLPLEEVFRESELIVVGEPGPMVRRSGEFAGKGFFLQKDFDWRIVEDSTGVLCLVPTRRQPAGP